VRQPGGSVDLPLHVDGERLYARRDAFEPAFERSPNHLRPGLGIA
jgi:hypothetical protein